MRFVAVVFLIFSEICDCVNSTRAIPKHFLPNSSALITSPRLHQDAAAAHRNLSVYLGYANNPFGPSTRLQSNKSRGGVAVSAQEDIRHHQHRPYQTSLPPHHQHLQMRFNRTAKYEHQHHHHQVVDNAIDSAGRPPPYSHRHHQQQQQEEPRSKRGVIHLYNMVSCATGCNPLIYKGYGCYCGFLGSGYPVDGIDRCCKMHDWCYDNAKCPSFHEYLIPYYWKCWNGRPICAIDWEDWSPCARNICECDRLLSECLSRYPCPSSRAICRSSTWRLLQNAFMIF